MWRKEKKGKREKTTCGDICIHSFNHGEPASPISESLAIIELSSHSSGEDISETGFPGLGDEGEGQKENRYVPPDTRSSGKSADNSSTASLTAIIFMLAKEDYLSHCMGTYCVLPERLPGPPRYCRNM